MISKPAAPIAIFAFNRLDLLRKTLDALQKADGFEESPIYVYSDGAQRGHRQEADEVNRLRVWLRAWCGTHAAKLSESPGNRGLRPSIISGVGEILELHDRVIVLEDDILVSQSFLLFMNDALEACCEREDIMQVCGWFVPHTQKLPPVGLVHVPGSWGWATWRRAWRHYRDDAEWLLAEVRKRDVRAFNVNNSYGYLEALEKNANGALNTWAVRWYASMFLRGGLALHPALSLVRNVGFQSDGTNCGPEKTAATYTRQRVSRERVTIDRDGLGTEESPAYVAALENFYRWQQAEWVKPTWRERLRARLALLAGDNAIR